MLSSGAMQNCRRIVSIAGICLVAVLSVGCGSGEPRSGAQYPVFPVEGEVYINDKPAEGVSVILVPVDLPQLSQTRGGLSPNGTTDENGVYTLSTYSQNDGAPAAKYNIRLRAPLKPPGFSKSDEGEIDRLDEQYNDANANAEADAQFTCEIQDMGDPKSAETQKIPRISLKVEGWEESAPPEEQKKVGG